MNTAKRSGAAGTLVAFTATVLLGSAATASAETALTVNGVDIDDAVLNMYVQSRLLARQRRKSSPLSRAN